MSESPYWPPAPEQGAGSDRDTSSLAGQQTLPGLESPTAGDVRVRIGRRRLKIAALVSSHVLLAGAGGAGGYLAWTNYDRAERWQERAVMLESNVEALNDVLVDRSATLNERTLELNAMATKVRESQRALRRSEADVAGLAERQRELANEKAQVEDARAALAAEAVSLEQVAAAFITCKSGLVDLIGYIARDDYDSANYYWDAVSYDCGNAEDALRGYVAAYG